MTEGSDRDTAQLTLEDDDPEPDESCTSECMHRYNPREDPEEFFSLLAMVTLGIGMVFIIVGYIYPRDYEFDPNEDAREMEQVELYYGNLSYALDVCIVTGMVLVGCGGVCMAGIMMYLTCTGQLSNTLCGSSEPVANERQALQLSPGLQSPRTDENQPSYGTAGTSATDS